MAGNRRLFSIGDTVNIGYTPESYSDLDDFVRKVFVLVALVDGQFGRR